MSIVFGRLKVTLCCRFDAFLVAVCWSRQLLTRSKHYELAFSDCVSLACSDQEPGRWCISGNFQVQTLLFIWMSDCRFSTVVHVLVPLAVTRCHINFLLPFFSAASIENAQLDTLSAPGECGSTVENKSGKKSNHNKSSTWNILPLVSFSKAPPRANQSSSSSRYFTCSLKARNIIENI